MLNALEQKFGSTCVKIDGSVTGVARQTAVDRFQTDDSVKLFIGNIKAAGIGITLTAASNVVFLELPWAPGDLVQAEDRCHRIGQKDTVNVWYLVAVGTVETDIRELLEAKATTLGEVLDGKAVQLGILGNLLERIRREGE